MKKILLAGFLLSAFISSCSVEQELLHHDPRDAKVIKVEDKRIFVTYDADTTTGQWVRVTSGREYKVGDILPHNPLMDFSRF